jgi:hypothetical protein
MSQQIRFNDLSSLTHYELNVFAKKHNIDCNELETFYLDNCNRDVISITESTRDTIEMNAFEKGREEGYDVGFKEGAETAEEQKEDLVTREYCSKKQFESWRTGYRDGYEDAIQWKAPKECKEELQQFL